MAKKLLVVVDEPDIRTFIRTILEDEGYNVTEANSGPEGLAKLKKTKFDLAIIDHFMPGMSGIQLTERIRKDPKIKDVKLVFLTAAIFNEGGQQELKTLKVLDYIKKPIENEDFIKRIKKIV